MLYESRPLSYEGLKITTASAMSAMEKKAIEEGDSSAEEYMKKAAIAMTKIVVNYIYDGGFAREVVLICAKGNNSGDAYAVGIELLEQGFTLFSLQVTPLAEASPLCKKQAEMFQKRGGKIIPQQEIPHFEVPSKAVIIDGLLGTGFHGRVEGEMAHLIEKVNHSHHAVISIDIPSGVSGDTGKVEGPAIFADLTISLGLFKVGQLYNQGYEHVGQITCAEFGMSPRYIEQIEPFAYVVHPKVIERNLPHHKRTANKYTIGQVAIFAGSPKYPGSAILAAHAALISGAGLVRLFHFEGMQNLLTQMKPEVIRTPFSIEAVRAEENRIKAVLVGPGLGREAGTMEMLEELYRIGNFPIVIDADALFFFKTIDRPCVLTPHRGELCHLLQCHKEIDDIAILDAAENFAKKHRLTLVFKGPPTTIVSFEGPRIVIPYGNIGMASGGMGDALAGIIASLLAQGMSPRHGAILGATLHAKAGDRAAEIKSEQSMTATDLINAIPDIFLSQEG